MAENIKPGDVVKYIADGEILLITDISNPTDVKYEVLEDDIFRSYTRKDIDKRLLIQQLTHFESSDWIKLPGYSTPLAKALRGEI